MDAKYKYTINWLVFNQFLGWWDLIILIYYSCKAKYVCELSTRIRRFEFVSYVKIYRRTRMVITWNLFKEDKGWWLQRRYILLPYVGKIRKICYISVYIGIPRNTKKGVMACPIENIMRWNNRYWTCNSHLTFSKDYPG